jgi:hypothetical protein
VVRDVDATTAAWRSLGVHDITHLGVRELPATSWCRSPQSQRVLERLGLAPLPFDLNVSLGRIYRGRPGTFDMRLGWGRWADVVFEWIQPTVGPSTYDEQLQRHGEGFHHLGFDVSDIDAAVARLRARGLAVTMSGGWDSGGNAGRFAYLDAERHGGVAVELLWNRPR